MKRENDGFCTDEDDAPVVPLLIVKDEEDLEAATVTAVRNALESPELEEWHTPALRELNSEVFCSYDPEKVSVLSRQAARHIHERKMKALRQKICQGIQERNMEALRQACFPGGGGERDDSTLPPPAEAGRYYGIGSKPQPLSATQKAEKRKLFLVLLTVFVVTLLLPLAWTLTCVGVMATTILLAWVRIVVREKKNPETSISTTTKVAPYYSQDGTSLMTQETLHCIVNKRHPPAEEEPLLS